MQLIVFANKKKFLQEIESISDCKFICEKYELNYFDLIAKKKFKLRRVITYALSRKLLNQDLNNSDKASIEELNLSSIIRVKIKIKSYSFIKIFKIVDVSSEFLNKDFYKNKYPDVFKSGMNLHLHFWKYGFFEGRQADSILIPKKGFNNLKQIYENLNDKNFEVSSVKNFLFEDVGFITTQVTIFENNLFNDNNTQSDFINKELNEAVKPIVSFVIPCYRQTNFLPEVIDSISKSTLLPHECLVVDDGNESEKAKRDLEALMPVSSRQKIVIVTQKNSGLSSARNLGRKYATGDYIKFVDADDLLIPGSTDVQIDALSNSKVSYAVGQHALYSEETDELTFSKYSFFRKYPTNSLENYFNSPLDFISGWEEFFSIPIHSLLIKKEVKTQFSEKLSSKEDLLFWLFLVENYKQPVFVDSTVAIYRQYDHQMSKNNLTLSGMNFWYAWFLAAQKNKNLFASDNVYAEKAKYLHSKYGKHCQSALYSIDEKFAKWASEMSQIDD